MSVDSKTWPILCRACHVGGLIAVTVFCLLAFGPAASAQSSPQRIYVDQGCAVCHGLMGHGGVGPDFVGDHFLVLGDYVIGQILMGRGQMPGFADELSDDQIAAVANYIRQSWGNKLGDLSSDQVKQLREMLTKSH